MNAREFAEEFYVRDKKGRKILRDEGYKAYKQAHVTASIVMRSYVPHPPDVADFTGLGPEDAAWLMFQLLVHDNMSDWQTPTTDAMILTPELNLEHFESDGGWCVCFEAGPHGWAIPVCEGRTAFMFDTPTRGILEADALIQPHYKFSLEFSCLA